MNKNFWNIISVTTNEILPLDTKNWISSSGDLLQLTHSLRFSPDMIDKTVQGLWRYKAMLPVCSEQAIISFGEGMTPIVKTKINGQPIDIKLEYLFPSGSYKDRGATLLISHMREYGLRKLVEDSSGNAGAAIATYAAKTGIKSEIVVSENTSYNKVRQLKMVGAEIIKIAGSREDVAQEAKRRAADDYFVQKLDASRSQTAVYLYGDNGWGDEEAFAGQEIPTFNYYINFGFTTSYGGGGSDAFFKIIQSTGAHVASRYYGGAGWADAALDGFFSLTNGIFLAGRTNSVGAGGTDAMVIRTSNISPYNITWQRAIGGTGDDEFLSMKEVPAGGVICAGFTTNFGATGEDIFICRIALNGTLTWARRIGGAGNERARAILPTADGGFIVAGYTSSAGAGGDDAFLIKLASDGSTQWAKVFGGASNDRFHALAIRPASFGYAAVGYSETFTNGGRDFYFVATDINGNTNCHQNNWTPTNVTVSPTLTTSGITVNSTGHNSIPVTFNSDNPLMNTTCRCIEERPRIDISGPTQVCTNQTGVVYSIPSVTGVTTYNWTATNATITSSLNSTSVTVNFGTNNAQLIVQASYGNCSNFNIDTINITIDPITANITGTSPICLNQSSLLTANAVNPQSGISGYSWSNNVNTQTNSVTPLVAGANIYTVTITDGLGCTATSSFTVNVNTLPTPGIISNSPVCIDQTITLQGTGGTSYSWIGPNAFSSSIQNPTIPNAQMVNAGTYTVIVTDANSCLATATTIVTVNAVPNASASNNGPLCETNTLQLNASGGNTYSWIGPNGFTSNAQNPSISNVTVAENGVYTVTVTDLNGCSSTATTNVTISPDLTVTISSNSPICVGETLNLISIPGSSHQWVGPASFISSLENPTINNVSLANVGTYTVTVTNAQGCTGTASIDVVINPNPIVSLGPDTTLCDNQTILLDAGNTGALFNWSDGSTNQTLLVSSAGTYIVTVTDANNCIASDDITVSYQPLPTVDLGADQILCQGTSLQIGNSYPGATYSWNTGATTPFINVTTPGTYTLTVSLCNTIVSDNIIINTDSLNVVLLSTTIPDCGQNNGSITVDAVNGIGSISYSWPAVPSQTTAQLTNIASGSYTVIATDQAGCTAAFTTMLSCNSPNLNIPQFLSPNGDGKNDIWVIDNLPTDFPNNQVKIFNRWGNEVYVASPYQNNWDGRPNAVLSLGSNILPSGTYFYVLDLFGDGTDVRTGFIELNP